MSDLLGSPMALGPLLLKNRFIMSPMHVMLTDRHGQVTQEMLAYFMERARGGAALLMTEYSYIDDYASQSNISQLAAHDDACMPGLARLASTIHEGGALAGLQLAHAGRQRYLGTSPMLAPSRVPWEFLHEMGAPVPEEATIEEISSITESFANAARRARDAGFDVVELHAGHGYFLCEFLSPHTNRRTDMYGGDLASRQRLLREVVEAVRGEVGPGFPVTVRLSGSEYLPNGIEVHETVDTAKMLEELGVSLIDISGGMHESPEHQVQPMYFEHGYHAAAAKAVKDSVGIPISVVGSITSGEVAERIIESGAADFVRLARPLLADPHLPRKIIEGRLDQVRPCIRCNACLERGHAFNRSVMCAVNFVCGKEYRYDSEDPGRTTRPRTITVVGGGPAGLEAARVASLRGHTVILYEPDQLGGTVGVLPDFKQDMRRFADYLIDRVTGTVEIVRRAATAELLLEQSPDVVLLAAGAIPVRARIPALHEERVVDAKSALRGTATGQRVVVTGGDQVAGDTALWLAENSKDVSVVFSEPELGVEMLPNNRRPLLERLRGLDVRLIGSSRPVAASEEGLVVEDIHTGFHIDVPCNTVVTTQYEPDRALAEELSAGPWLLKAIGDAAKPRRVLDAIHDANYATRVL